ncbi:histidinol-phosphatase [uncultured Rothia sp.]|uniref:histidinol-phosphatase n=1 Tax=uncultured Rothia sp. TaxID=316088 RepID=UPI0032175D91
MHTNSYTDDLRLAHILADSVDRLTLTRFQAQNFTVSTKPDLTPVTDADCEAEQLIRSQLSRVRTRDSILGEEFGETGSSPRQWVIDPIDGTKNFVRGVPVWATLIALLDHGKPVVGLVSAPALNRRWWAAEGTGAYTGRSLANAKRITVSGVDQISDASLSYSSLSGWKNLGVRDRFIDLTDEVWRTRAYGDFWSYCMVAEGSVDIAAEPDLQLYDIAALVPIVQEAGGKLTSLTGEVGPHGGNALATNTVLHDQALTYVGI